MRPGVKLDRVTSVLRECLRREVPSRHSYYPLSDFCNLTHLLAGAMEAYDEHHALLAAANRTETFPRLWWKCPEFVECLRKRGYVRVGDEGGIACGGRDILEMYELWQDGKRGELT